MYDDNTFFLAEYRFKKMKSTLKISVFVLLNIIS